MFNKDVKVPLQEAELVGTSSSNIYFKLSKNSGRVGRGSGNGRGQGRGRETGYTSKPKTLKLSTIKDLLNGVRWS